jgi:lysozyme
MNDTYGAALLDAELTQDEGKERIPYVDSRGHLSGGVGRNLGKGFSDDEIALMFANDKRDAVHDLDANAAWWRTLMPQHQRVMINLTFNMGWPVLSQFKRFLAAMKLGNWTVAAAELKDSAWWGQVGTRGPRVVARLLAPDGTPIA